MTPHEFRVNLANLAIKSLVIVQGWFSSWVRAHSPSQQCTVAGFLASRICFYGSSVCFWACCSHFLSQCVLYVPILSLSFSLPLSLCICWLEYWCCRLLLRNDFHCFSFASRVFFLRLFSPSTFNLFLFFSLCLFSPVWPGPGHPHPQCMYYYLSFFFISLHHCNVLTSARCASSF